MKTMIQLGIELSIQENKYHLFLSELIISYKNYGNFERKN